MDDRNARVEGEEFKRNDLTGIRYEAPSEDEQRRIWGNPTSELLAERGKTHGSFDENAAVAQQLKAVIEHHGTELDYVQREALDFICSKIGRICSGNADFRDHWDDIAGYAKLVADRCPR